MALPQSPKQPLDVLQNVVNSILVEVGRTLRASNRSGEKALSAPNPRLQSSLPGAIDRFHRALDDLEADIIRAKAVFIRDLRELQVKQETKVETPTSTVIDVTTNGSVPTGQEGQQEENRDLESASIAKDVDKVATPKEEVPINVEQSVNIDDTKETTQDPPKLVAEVSQTVQDTSPPTALAEDKDKENAIALGVDDSIQPDAAPATENKAEDQSVESLFDIGGTGDDGGDPMNFDNMDFLDATDGQCQEEFDLSTFGNTEDFNLDLTTSAEVGNALDAENKSSDAIFNLDNNNSSNDLMDLDLDFGPGGDESIFDDMVFGGTEDLNAGTGAEMEHGDHDNIFFGLD